MNMFDIEKVKTSENKMEHVVQPQISFFDLPLSVINPEKKEICKQNIELLKAQTGFESISSTMEKGNLGEIITDVDMQAQGYERISEERVTDIQQPGHKGIDGIYYNPKTDMYAIIESKYGSSRLGETQDGGQMSWQWIDARLDEAVGEKTADKIREQYVNNPEHIRIMVANVKGTDKVTYKQL